MTTDKNTQAVTPEQVEAAARALYLQAERFTVEADWDTPGTRAMLRAAGFQIGGIPRIAREKGSNDDR